MAVDGTWKIKMKTPMGPQVGTMELAAQQQTLTGTVTLRGDTLAISNGAIDGDQLTWDIKMRKPLPMTGHFTASLDGDRLIGKAKVGPMGEVTFEGSRSDGDGES